MPETVADRETKRDTEHSETEPKTLALSVIIPVLNEEQNIAACLESVRFADEVFVVDSGSTDRTAAIAEQMGAKVVQFR
ncbi:glycosyltransferase, partial [Thermogutta sp.]|uniref:glycosyltransferase n=1 Tax=Thermogutta sp. TaxID=1962930 RepID=UPI00321F839E